MKLDVIKLDGGAAGDVELAEEQAAAEAEALKAAEAEIEAEKAAEATDGEEKKEGDA